MRFQSLLVIVQSPLQGWLIGPSLSPESCFDCFPIPGRWLPHRYIQPWGSNAPGHSGKMMDMIVKTFENGCSVSRRYPRYDSTRPQSRLPFNIKDCQEIRNRRQVHFASRVGIDCSVRLEHLDQCRDRYRDWSPNWVWYSSGSKNTASKDRRRRRRGGRLRIDISYTVSVRASPLEMFRS